MPTLSFEDFLHRARRHWMAWSIAECAAIGLLGGCACVVLLLPILLWRGEPGQNVATVFPLLGTLAGAIVGFRKRPGLEEVAKFADHRFDTADLLATALILRGSTDPWNANIVKMADACSAGLSPALLTPHRLGTRAWSGIALALIAAITLGLLSITTASDRAEAATAATPGAERAWEKNDAHEPKLLQHDATAVREARAEATPESRSMRDTDLPSPDHQSVVQSKNGLRESQANVESNMVAGGGSARTESIPAPSPTAHGGSPSNNSPNDGRVAAGGLGTESQARADGGMTAGQVSTGGQLIAAPLSSSAWPAAQAEALGEIRAGKVPDGYRDLVRDYFQRGSAGAGESRGQ